ncbi:MAG: TetR/AcrR family transcriptional regulator [Candidatus Izemoplasmatales bacterium]
MSSEDIRRKIIENTKQILKENSQITIKSIADKSCVNIAAVNYHFGSKDHLMQIVVSEILDEVKAYILNEQFFTTDQITFENKLEMMIEYLYNFALENIGLLNYLFLSNELQKDTTNLIVKEFFTDNDFTRQVYTSLSERTKIMNPTQLQAKYMVLFSSFCIPLFIQISQAKLSNSMKLDIFKSEEFRKYFIKDIMKMIEA